MILPLVLASLVSVEPAVRPEKWWMDAFEAKRAFVATNRDVKVAFVGDSITARWGMKEGKAAWEKYFARRGSAVS